jgi:radical SAM superfamily enzyme YgiQ (UPF0313 family)
MIFAYPGEGRAEQRESLKLVMDICRNYPGAEFWTNIFTPYPGAPIMERAFELGIEVPKKLEEWADFFPRYTVLPWLKGHEHQRLQTMREYLRLAFNRIPIGRQPKRAFAQRLHDWISRPARWRIDHDFFAFPFELWLKNNVNRWFPTPSSCPQRWPRADFPDACESSVFGSQTGAEDAAVSAAADANRGGFASPGRA